MLKQNVIAMTFRTVNISLEIKTINVKPDSWLCRCQINRIRTTIWMIYSPLGDQTNLIKFRAPPYTYPPVDTLRNN